MKKLFIITLFGGLLLSSTSCNKCRTCQAKQLENLIDFNKECGTDEAKQQMEEDFRKQYPDSLYAVMCS